jgi:uncharacterized alkaline shock family protein YloU
MDNTKTHDADAASERGKTTVADGVVAKIAGIAAREVEGVHELLSQGVADAITGLAQRVTRGDIPRAQGVKVEIGQREAVVDLKIIVLYGVNIPQVAESVRRNIINRVQAMTGLTVTEVNVDVIDLFFPEEKGEPVAQPRAA